MQQQARGGVACSRGPSRSACARRGSPPCAPRRSARRRTGCAASRRGSARARRRRRGRRRPTSISACRRARSSGTRCAAVDHVQRRRRRRPAAWPLLARAPARAARGRARRRARPRAGRRASGRARPGPARPRCGRCRRPVRERSSARDHGLGQAVDRLAHAAPTPRPACRARRGTPSSCATAILFGSNADHRAVAADDLVALVRRCGGCRPGAAAAARTPERRASPGRWLLAWIPLWALAVDVLPGRLRVMAPELVCRRVVGLSPGTRYRECWAASLVEANQDTRRTLYLGSGRVDNHYL